MNSSQNPYLECIDDGLYMRESGAWAAEKLDYLFRYLNIFSASMSSKKWRGINYIDLFCGPGKCKIRDTNKIILGSSILSLKLQHLFTQYFLVDAEPLATDALKTRCSDLIGLTNIDIHTGDGNKIAADIVQKITTIDKQFIKGSWPSLNIAFLDPEGFELHWDTVALLGSIQRMDLIIYYPQMGLTREMPKTFNNPLSSKIDQYFGCQTWRIIYEQYRNGQIKNLHRALLDLYEDNLKSLGYVDITENEPLMRNTNRKAPLYRLIFASKHPLGNQFWGKVTNRDVYGQARLC